MAFRSFSSAARLSSLKAVRYSSMVLGLAAMACAPREINNWLCDILRSKKPFDLSIARFSRKLLKWSSVRVACLAKRGKPFQESRNPPDVSMLNGIGKVVKLNGQVSTHLAQILDCPPCRRSAELTVDGVYFRASFK